MARVLGGLLVVGMSLALSTVAHAQCQEEDALAETAATLLLSDVLDPATVRDALFESGSDLPSVRVVRDLDGVATFAATADGEVVCGQAQGDSGSLWVVAARGGSLQVQGDALVVQLHPDFRDAYVAFVGDSGAADERGGRVGVHDGERLAWPQTSGPITAQLVATGPGGPRPVAERTRGGDVRTEENLQSDAPLPTRLERLREEVGSAPLRDNRLLREEAAAHARTVCAAGRAGHVGEGGRDPEARLRRRGIVARVVGETVARARTETEAFAALLQSPSHRLTLIDRRFTDVGIATVTRGGGTCVVVELAAWPQYRPR